MQTQLLGMLYRLLEVSANAAPTVLVGFLLAGIIKRLVGYELTRDLFGGRSLRSIPQAWLIGMLLPVCSLGALPVIRQLHKAGVPGGAILAFAISAPLFNPISLLYGLSVGDPLVILTFASLSLLIVTIVGVLVEKVLPFPESEAEQVPAVSYGIRRMLAVAVTASREARSPVLWYIGLGLVGSAVLSLFLPFGYLQDKAERSDVWAPLFMAVVSLPMYETPMTMIIKLGDMFQHGNSVGAAFSLMILGAGINAGVYLWLWLHYGKLRTFACVGVLFGIVVGLSYLVDAPLTQKGIESQGHTHAFDVYCCPFPSYDSVGLSTVLQRFGNDLNLNLYKAVSLVGLAILIGLGLLFSHARFPGLESWLEQKVDRTGTWDVELSPKVLGGVSLAGLVGMSVFGSYLYYPSMNEVFESLKDSQTPLAAAGVTKDWDAVEYWLPIVDDWSRRVQVSAYLRRIPQTEEHAQKAHAYREILDLLRHAAEDRDAEESRRYSLALQRAYTEYKAAYFPGTARSAREDLPEEMDPEQVDSKQMDPEELDPAELEGQPIAVEHGEVDF